MVAHPKFFLDQVSDAITGPQRRFITEPLRPFQQPGDQLLALLIIEQRFAARAADSLQRPLSFFGHGSGPTTHGLAADLNPATHFALVVDRKSTRLNSS